MLHLTLSLYYSLTGGYITVFLESIGFNPAGRVVTALNSGVASFPHLLGHAGDKMRSLKKVLNSFLSNAILFALIPLTSGVSIWGISFLYF